MKVLEPDIYLEIPESVAVCPICKSKLYAHFEAWIEIDGKWKANEVHLDCVTEPDIEENSFEWECWFESHYSMPYVDWLPVCQHVLEWINQNYEFNL